MPSSTGGARPCVYFRADVAEEGLYPEYFGFKLFQMDNYTDTVMLFEAASADEAPPLTAMMTNTAYNVDNFETLAEDPAMVHRKGLEHRRAAHRCARAGALLPTRGTGTAI